MSMCGIWRLKKRCRNQWKDTLEELGFTSEFVAQDPYVIFLFCFISDLSWSVHENSLFVTCSADTYVYIWDLRCDILHLCRLLSLRHVETGIQENQLWHGRLLVCMWTYCPFICALIQEMNWWCYTDHRIRPKQLNPKLQLAVAISSLVVTTNVLYLVRHCLLNYIAIFFMMHGFPHFHIVPHAHNNTVSNPRQPFTQTADILW